MAPKVCVPMDFGRQHIDSIGHSNLTLELEDGARLRTNSLILSYNSAELERLTGEFYLTTLQLEDFSAPASRSFVDSLYSGDITTLTTPVFRDVYKMSKTFKVDWLENKCESYFSEQLEISKEHPDLTSLFDIAQNVMLTFKDRFFLCLVAERLFSIDTTESFVKNYTQNFTALSHNQIDSLVVISGQDANALVKAITANITETNNISELTEYALRNIDVDKCIEQSKGSDLDELFRTISSCENVKDSDWKIAAQLQTRTYQTITKKYKSSLWSPNIGNVCLSLEDAHDESFADLLGYLEKSTVVQNFYSFVDALVTWMYARPKEEIPKWTTDIYKQILCIKANRGWGKINKDYFNYIIMNYNAQSKFFAFFEAFSKESSAFVTTKGHYPSSFYSTEVITGSKLLTTEHIVHLKYASNNKIEMKLHIVPDNESAAVKVVLIDGVLKDEAAGSNQFVRLKADDLHLFVKTKKSDTVTLEWSAPPIPITWCGKIRAVQNEDGETTIGYKWGSEKRSCDFEKDYVLQFHAAVHTNKLFIVNSSKEPSTGGLFGLSTSDEKKSSTLPSNLFGFGEPTPGTASVLASGTTTTTTSSGGGGPFSSNLFGATPTTGLFSAATSSGGGLFGDVGATPAASTTITSASSGGLFGSTPSTGSMFGSTPTTSSAGTAAGLFGAAPAATGGLFSAAPAATGGFLGGTTTAASSASSGLFSATISSSSGLFGAPAATTASSSGTFGAVTKTKKGGFRFG